MTDTKLAKGGRHSFDSGPLLKLLELNDCNIWLTEINRLWQQLAGTDEVVKKLSMNNFLCQFNKSISCPHFCFLEELFRRSAN
jgi:hypothetical protein